jgi:hypothetical protein
VRRLPINRRIVLSHVAADIPGAESGAGFVLFIKNGVLDALEGCMFDGSWPENIPSFRLKYSPDPKRNMETIRKELS